MLDKLVVRNFKLFEEVEIELGERVVFVGPNNSGKTTALQAIALWDLGAKRWLEARGAGPVPKKRPGVTINRRDLLAIPVPIAAMLWRDLHISETGHALDGRKATRRIRIGIGMEGIDDGAKWVSSMEFDYANPESFYCRPSSDSAGEFLPVPESVRTAKVAYLPPMSGLGSNEVRLEPGAVQVRLGEGRTAEVLRNLCFRVFEKDGFRPVGGEWEKLAGQMKALFGIMLEPPEYIQERGEIRMSYRTRGGVSLDLSASGRGQQQTLLLLAHMYSNPGSILLLDEPDAHLEILRQRQIYRVLSDTAERSRSQIILASHSEVILNEAAGRDVVVAFVGRPHRIDDRGSQVRKSLQDIGFEHYYLAEETGWVLYLEGSTDLDILRALAAILGHAAKDALDRPFVEYVANQPTKARDHFHGLREAKRDLVGIAIFDRLEGETRTDPFLQVAQWKRREIENYLADRRTLYAWAEAEGREQQGELFSSVWVRTMEQAIDEAESAFETLGKPSGFSHEIKASDDFLGPLFNRFYKLLSLPNLMDKTNFHRLAPFVPLDAIDPEIPEMLDRIAEVARSARPRTD